MKGNTLTEFINDLLNCGGPEKEFTFNGNHYFLETTTQNESDLLEMVIFIVNNTDDVIFSCTGKTFQECTEQFETAKIFDGKTIYEVEDHIEVLYG